MFDRKPAEKSQFRVVKMSNGTFQLQECIDKRWQRMLSLSTVGWTSEHLILVCKMLNDPKPGIPLTVKEVIYP